MARRTKRAKEHKQPDLYSLMGGSAIKRVFETMEVAEEVLAEKGLSDAPGVFLFLQPPEGMLGLDLRVYRSHAVELCDRFNAGVDTRLATKAEVLVDLMHVSLKAPLNQAGAMMYERLFVDVLGELPPGVKDANHKEEWPGQFDENLAEARKKLRKDNRKFTERGAIR